MGAVLKDFEINIKLKLSALWTAVMFCYIYADILGLYDKWLIGEILKGNMGPLGPITQELKLGVAMLMSIPAIMVFLSLVLKPKANRWANVVFGALFTAVIIVTLLMDPWFYYIYFGILEIVFTVLIVWCAWKWPEQKSTL